MTLNEMEIILHAIKSVDASQKRHDTYKDGIYDMMFKELNIKRPNRRVNGVRRLEDQK